MPRRQFLKNTITLLGALAMSPSSLFAQSTEHLFMPEESEPHKCTWMAFVANDTIWSKRQIPAVKYDLIRIAKTIAQYEPVNMLASPEDYEEAISLLGGLDNHNFPIQLIEFAVDDLWLRDTAPTFVKDKQGKKYAIDFNFNGWGNKQEHSQDKQVARVIAKQAGVPRITTDLVTEGGSFEVDGHGTALLTKSSVINDNRNPGWSQAEIETELKALLGLKKIIWLEGLKGEDITDAHIDFYARFTRQGEVVISRENYKPSSDYRVTRENIATLKAASDAQSNALKLTVIDNPNQFYEGYGVEDFAAGYIGYYVCNDAVIMQGFGDKILDKKAKERFVKAFPDRVIEQIRIDGIASGGGTIHCATMQEFI